MSISTRKMMLASIVMFSALVGERTGQQGLAQQNKGKKPEPVVRLMLEEPPTPIVLDLALSGKIPIRLCAENLSDKPVIMCRPVDGSYIVNRDPAYAFRLVDGKGHEVRRSTEIECPWLNPLHVGDFITLEPKKKVDLLKSAGTFGELTTHLFQGLKPGEYKLSVTYTMTGEGKTGGIPERPLLNPRVPPLLEKALKGEIVSNAVKVRFVASPATADELLKIADGKGDKVLSRSDAFLVLGHRRIEEGYRPMLAALSDKDWEVRWAAAFSLRHYAAAYSVGQMKHKDIIPPELIESLSAATKDSDHRVREVANFSLKFAKEYRDYVKSKQSEKSEKK